MRTRKIQTLSFKKEHAPTSLKWKEEQNPSIAAIEFVTPTDAPSYKGVKLLSSELYFGTSSCIDEKELLK